MDDPLAGDQDARWANTILNPDRGNFIPLDRQSNPHRAAARHRAEDPHINAVDQEVIPATGNRDRTDTAVRASD
ncbi:hypothetical protein Pme01_53320 [Planosporangium mesophilum]|uniref:Uncharacterized protein n=1 Tax=Planosporangium mesophilum TaxID=689768 RepID=A0A8J3TEM4_9ACTN|nr:hypothetical protein Pme01_53320 [Planosporangium mesophilum]